jgi:hypothetical protein
MQVHATGELSSAIIIDTDAISRLWNHANDFAGNTSATVSCADGIERKFANLGDLLVYENAARSAAQTIEIYGRCDTPARSITITIGREYGARASLSIRGEEHEVTSARTKIMDSFSGMRAWYSAIATADLWFFWMVTITGLLLVLQLMAPSKAPDHPGRSFSEAIHALGYVLRFIAPIFVVIYGVTRLRRRFFPMVSMAFGQGSKRHHTDEQVRWTVIVGFVVGIAGSAAYAAMSGT